MRPMQPLTTAYLVLAFLATIWPGAAPSATADQPDAAPVVIMGYPGGAKGAPTVEGVSRSAPAIVDAARIGRLRTGDLFRLMTPDFEILTAVVTHAELARFGVWEVHASIDGEPLSGVTLVHRREGVTGLVERPGRPTLHVRIGAGDTHWIDEIDLAIVPDVGFAAAARVQRNAAP